MDPKPTAFRNLIGQRFGRLLVVSETDRVVANRRRYLCQCDCGKSRIVYPASLTRTDRPTESCGCIRIERVVSSTKTHGRYQDRTYGIWEGIIQRCTNPNCTHFDYYGGRGITVCDRWRSFTNFIADMGEPTTATHTIDRIDTNKGYEPSNCRWATREEQQKNRRNARLITFEGRIETAHMWSKILGIPSRTIFNRIAKGLPPEEVLRKR